MLALNLLPRPIHERVAAKTDVNLVRVPTRGHARGLVENAVGIKRDALPIGAAVGRAENAPLRVSGEFAIEINGVGLSARSARTLCRRRE